MTILTLKQMENIVHLIIDIGAEAEARGRITPAEKEAILAFTSTATACREVLDDVIALGKLKND